MTRFATQPHLNTCAPIAVLNAAKWAGLRFTMKDDYRPLIKLCGTDLKIGTWLWGIDRGLRIALGNRVKVTRKRQATVWAIENHLELGGAVVACDKRHVFLITGQTSKMFIIQNYDCDRATQKVKKSTIRKTIISDEVWFLNERQ